ncbi:MAG TPA: efflux RND transporter periplasmic adaptor subunit [Phycisphaerales bacterium]|nr:efflux RND transporter periplasmic adaptor subunit [Phycisphaerales bacterium]
MKHFMKSSAAMIILGALLLFPGCEQTPHGHPHGPNGEHTEEAGHGDHGEQSEAEPIARTEFSEKLLNFFEFAPLKPQEPSSFLIHLTELKTGEPVSQADVKLIIKGPNGKELDTVQAKVGRVTGIYVAEVKIPLEGTYGIDFQVKNEKLQDTLSLKGFQVAANPADPPAEESGSTETVPFLMEQQWMIDMRLAQVETKELATPIHSNGRIIPAANNHAQVSSPVRGRLNGGNLPIVGRRVQADEPIASILETPTAGEMAQVQAALAQVEAARVQTSAQLQSENAAIRNQNAQARIENARLKAEKTSLAEQLDLSQSRLNQAKKEMKRAQGVYEVEGISARELQAAELQLKKAQAEFEQTRAKKDALEKVDPIPLNPQLDVTPPHIDSINTRSALILRAPFSGVVTEVHKSLGEQVDSGEPILEIANTRDVWLTCPVYEKDLGAVHEGVQAQFSVLSYPDREFTASLIHLGEVIDEETRATDAIFQISNQEQLLRLGMQAKVRIAGQTKSKTVVIPKEAVLDREGKKIVYVLVTGEEFERRDVEVSEDFGPMVGVVKGLSPGERVVTQGAYQLFLQETNPADSVVHSHET